MKKPDDFSCRLGDRLKDFYSSKVFRSDVPEHYARYEVFYELFGETKKLFERQFDLSTITNERWVSIFDNFAENHDGLIPDAIIVQCYFGWSIVHKNFYLRFSPQGDLLRVKLVTNETSVGEPVERTYEVKFKKKEPYKFVGFLDIEEYLIRQ